MFQYYDSLMWHTLRNACQAAFELWPEIHLQVMFHLEASPCGRRKRLNLPVQVPPYTSFMQFRCSDTRDHLCTVLTSSI